MPRNQIELDTLIIEEVLDVKTSLDIDRKLQKQLDIPKSKVCPDCKKSFTSYQSMKTHYESLHIGIFYSCKICDHKATQKTHLKNHIKSKHIAKQVASSYIKGCDREKL